MTGKKNRVGVLIPTYSQRVDVVSQTINSLIKAINYFENKADRSTNVNVYLLENGSDNFSDSTFDDLISYRNYKTANKSKVLNEFIAEKRDDYLAFIFFDDDVILSENIIFNYIQILEKNNFQNCVTGGSFDVVFESSPKSHYLKYYPVSMKGLKVSKSKGYFLGFNWCCTSDLLENSIFDERKGPGKNTLGRGQESSGFKILEYKGANFIHSTNCFLSHFITKDKLTFDWLINRYVKKGGTAGLDAKSVNVKHFVGYAFFKILSPFRSFFDNKYLIKYFLWLAFQTGFLSAFQKKK